MCDFGVSNRVELTRQTKAANAGTLRYMPPEQLDEQLNTRIDIWALGCVILHMITGKIPFDGLSNEFRIYRELQMRTPLEYAQKHFSEEFSSNAMWQSEELQDFLSSCMQVDYQKRPTAAELLKHPFLK